MSKVLDIRLKDLAAVENAINRAMQLAESGAIQELQRALYCVDLARLSTLADDRRKQEVKQVQP